MEEKKEKPSYICSKCGEPVDVKETGVVRKCQHNHDSIIANISAVCKGQGRSFKEKK